MPQGFTPSFESSQCELLLAGVKEKYVEKKIVGVPVELREREGRRGCRKKSETREERVHMERVPMRMAERREETWRPMNRQRVAAFIQMYLLAIVYDENAYRQPAEKRKSRKILNEALVRRIIPYIYRNRVWTLDESLWPITLEDFKELDCHLTTKLPKIHAGRQWQMISYYFKEIERERDEWKGWRRRRERSWKQ